MKISVLDKGYIRLVDSMGDDRSVVNAARVSYDKESQEFNEKDERLLSFLVRENHTAPFRHAILTYEIYAPLMIKNQWIKHLIGGIHHDDQEFVGLDPLFAWNESSRRYVTENEEFYEPRYDEWRGKPGNSKQGSGENLPSLSSPKWKVAVSQASENYKELNYIGNYWTDALAIQTANQVAWYREALEAGVAPEQARLFLPAYAMYVRWRWTTSLQGAMHFIKLRDESHAQVEIQEYARAVKDLTATRFPVSIGAL